MMQELKCRAEHCRQNDFALLGSMIALALVVSLLAGCSGSGSQPMVTDDDLTPALNVQEIIETVADNGKTYGYLWPAENQGADPIVPPQEAANRAGQAMEELYGMDLTGQTVLLQYWDERDVEGMEDTRPYWEISSPELLGPERDPSYAQCWMDATTGEITTIRYIMGEQDRAEYLKTPAVSCHVPLDDNPDGLAGWDTDDPEFDKIIEQVKERAAAALSGSVLTGGSQVTEIEYVPDIKIVPPPPFITLKVTCENGKIYLLTQWGHALFYPEYDCSGYPLRAFEILVSDPESWPE